MKKTILIPLACLLSNSINAQGISSNEYQKMKASAECALIANMIKPGTLSQEEMNKTFNSALSAFKKNTPLMLGYDYNPSPDQLAIDFAVHYQQITSDVNDEMFQSVKDQNLPLSPESWFSVAKKFWKNRNCSIIAGL
ncbi:hypothetical protein ACEUDH_02985 [Aeromonas dhakensis]|uniref:hypothetical protein n=1 Tax=Aeromonas dhakensis TaxID=196024 RepID=UPI0038D0489D